MEKKKKEEKRRASCSQTFSTSPPHFTRCAYGALPKVPPLLKKKKKKATTTKKKGRSFLRASQGGAHTPVATRAFPSRSVRMAVCLSFSRPATASPRFTSPPPPSFFSFFFSSALRLPEKAKRSRNERKTQEREKKRKTANRHTKEKETGKEKTQKTKRLFLPQK